MELSNEKYLENINTVYNALCDDKREFDTVASISSVPASVKLTENGNVLYVDNGKLRVLPVRYAKQIKDYCLKNNLVNKTAEKTELSPEAVAEGVVSASLVAEI